MCALHRLSGQSCSHWEQSRCTRTVSPEASQQSRCALLEQRRKMGVRALDRLERLKRLEHPDDREVARRHVISKNVEAIESISCPEFVSIYGQGPLCVHQHLVYCLLLLPICEGRCDDFLLRREISDPEENRQ